MSETMTAELLPCPFCGSAVDIFGCPCGGEFVIRCECKNVQFPPEWVSIKSKDEVIALWNRRAELASVAELEARLALADRLADAAETIISRYVKETPLGHQPHMIAHVAEKWLSDVAAYRAGKAVAK